jgi:membrane protein
MRAVGERVRDLVQRRLLMLGDTISHLLHVRIMDSATVLAAKGFTAVLPVLFVAAAFFPSGLRDQLKDSVRGAAGLRGASLTQVTSSLSAPDGDTKQAYGLVGILIVLVSATSFSRSLQAMCERCWHMPKATSRVAAWRWFAWLSVFLLALMTGIALYGWLGMPAVLVPGIVLGILFWWWTQRLLLARRVGWLPLLPGAVLAGISLAAWLAVSRVYLPNELNRSIARYGPLGSVFTILSWILCCTLILTISFALGYLIIRRQPFSRWFAAPDEPG